MCTDGLWLCAETIAVRNDAQCGGHIIELQIVFRLVSLNAGWEMPT
jgi:hypothetical protein